MPHTHRIGLVFSYSLAYCRGILRGIKEYASHRADWVFTSVAPEDGGAKALRELKPAGIIAHIYNEPLREALVSLRKPVVNVCGVLEDDGRLPRVGLDDDAIGRAAAGHLIDRGLRHFAFAGHPSHAYSVLRESAFGKVLKESGFSFSSYYESRSAFDPRGRLWALEASVRTWLASLPRPVGLFACNDIWGVQLTEACRQAGLRVPEDVVLVGVDDDDLLCELARPSLSSVAIPAREVGRRAAALLDRMLRGGRPPTPAVLLPPRGVVTRQSSDIVALDDPDVSAAVAFIRARAHDALVMDQVLEAATVCRRTLERRFRRALGRSLWDEIRRVRIERATRMLSESDASIATVARAAGFSDGKHLCVVFRLALGTTPTHYRRQFRGGSGMPRPAPSPKSPPRRQER
jgi:LacI family transcriptional regulator